jgi:hypothetical protein
MGFKPQKNGKITVSSACQRSLPAALATNFYFSDSLVPVPLFVASTAFGNL